MIRGVGSAGMLCSGAVISQDHDGIIDLPDDIAIGTPAEALGLDDPMFYIKVTPNRPDAVGARHRARPRGKGWAGSSARGAAVPGGYQSPSAALDFADGDTSCPLFISQHFRGVSRPSPDWLSAASAIGLRPISALVGTNYITMTGRCTFLMPAGEGATSMRGSPRGRRCWHSTGGTTRSTRR